jgi:hypothetical protein
LKKDNKDSQRAVDAVKDWLKNHSGWLLIFDNADDPEVVLDFLPLPSQAHILLTTRAIALGRIAERIEIDTMEIDEGARFLLRRAGKSKPTVTDQSSARTPCRVLCKEALSPITPRPVNNKPASLLFWVGGI